MLTSIYSLFLAIAAVSALPKSVILDYNTKQLNLLKLGPAGYAIEIRNIDTLVKHDTKGRKPDVVGPTRVQNIRFNFEYKNDHMLIGGKPVKEGVTQIYAMAQIPDCSEPSIFNMGVVGMEVDVTITRLHLETFIELKVLILEINGDKLDALAASMVLVTEEVHGQIRSHQAHKYGKVFYLSMMVFAIAWVLIFVIGSIVAMFLGKHRYQAVAITDESDKAMLVKSHTIQFEKPAI